MGKYELVCPWCNRVTADNYTLSCPCNSLIRTKYYAKRLTLRQAARHVEVLRLAACGRPYGLRGTTVTYRSEGLARELGIDLHVAFNGYWPEIGADMKTCSFKELEAPPTIVRAREHGGRAMVLASAGNTARAFAYLSTLTGFPLIIVVPEKNADRLWIPGREPGPSVKLITLAGDCDYTDAITLANRIAGQPGLLPEGGAKNVARRDGMATVMLDAAVTMKVMPDDYFQSIGSGTGGIAAWEASMRLRADGRFGSQPATAAPGPEPAFRAHAVCLERRTSRDHCGEQTCPTRKSTSRKCTAMSCRTATRLMASGAASTTP